jgi:hypothetical protein
MCGVLVILSGKAACRRYEKVLKILSNLVPCRRHHGYCPQSPISDTSDTRLINENRNLHLHRIPFCWFGGLVETQIKIVVSVVPVMVKEYLPPPLVTEEC